MTKFETGGVDFLMIIFPLFSGSAGNSTYLKCKNTAVLVDVGRSAKQTEDSLIQKNLHPSKINFIFITHEHLDHVKGLHIFASKYKIPVYSSKGTINFFRKKNNSRVISDKLLFKVIPSKGVEIGDFFVKSFNVSHDCCEGIGYIFETQNERKIAFVTDTGCVTNEMRNSIVGCDTLFLESNHDVKMVECGKYPYNIKKRIISDIGHLSNEDCAKELPNLVNSGLTHIILSHLSKNNNLAQLAYQTAVSTLFEHNMKENIDYTLFVSKNINNSCCSF
ncbi:MAG: MBL fold metallo-hydrolase [Oscillospiraceae bacterium]|jgi:phosphoribosyl 1,2-cyclic phosphodiesterase|nr:MBL fold metallo-hydrolase [Oscillospiraceae bacterium]